MLIGNQVDSTPHAWYLAWGPYALTHGHNPLFTDYLGAPHGANLAWNTPVLLPGFVAWPVSAQAGPVATFDLVITLGPALAAFAAHLAFRRYTQTRAAAALGGLAAGFSPYLLAHAAAGHSNQVTVLTVPLLLLLLDDLLVRQRRSAWRLGMLLGVLAAAQMYITEEVLAGEVISAAAGVAVLAVVAGGRLRQLMLPRLRRRLAQALLAATPVFALLTAPLLLTQFRGAMRISGAIQPANRYVTDLANLVVPTRLQAVAPHAATAISDRFTGNAGEWGGYLGVPLLLTLAAIAAWQWRRLTVRWAALTAAAMVLLSLGPSLHVAGHDTHIPLPWRLLGHLPLLDSALPARLVLFAVIPCGLLLAIGADAVLQRGRSDRRVLAVGGVALAAVAATLMPALPFATRPTATPAFFTGARIRDAIPAGSTAYILPSVKPDTMLWQLQSGMRFRMLGGWYFSPDARGHVHDGPAPTPLFTAVARIEQGGTAATPPTAAQLATFRDELRADAVQSIVVTDREPHRPAIVEFFTQLTGTPPHDDGAGTLYWTGLRL